MKLVFEEEITMELQNAFVLKVCFLEQSMLKFSKNFKPCQVRGMVAATSPIYLGSGANFGPKIMFP